MTVTVYSAKFSSDGKPDYSGSISWDKYTPKTLDATLCPFTGPSEVDYPVWRESAAHSRSGLETLVAKMKEEALTMGLTIVTEGETKFAVR